MDTHPYSRVTQYHETDQMGIINHINYIRWMEEARVDYLEQLGYGYDWAVAEGIDFALLGIRCRYRAMCRFRETIDIHVFLKSVTPVRMTVGYRMVGQADGTLRFEGESDHCYFSAQKQRPVGLHKALPDLYALLTTLVQPEGT